MTDDKGGFVSRGGLKLDHALSYFDIQVSNLIVLDIGSSTGGFVDCLLQHGAAKVYSVDTAYGELAWKLRNDPRVVVMERINALHLPDLPEQVDLVTIDASWTKLEKILPVIQKTLKPEAKIIALLKPHYQTDKRNLVKGVLPEEIAQQVKDDVIVKISDLGFEVLNTIDSPILGGGGNKEFLLLIQNRD